MSETIKYGFNNLAAASEDIASSARNVAAELDELKNVLAPMAESWVGEAADSYWIHQKKWDDAAHELNEILNTIADNVRQGSLRMEGINSAIARSWSGA
ncbi:WXG100 family type VII secretion target [Corynebacterium cystitidis]|uniref:ESAT-6-like protein n=1 Tax=Corynebacterium cystitidis DSM 20524 TaxID=1121357 RepID=A0A1H9R0A3_9CORY|nr:WXG100 family type VII secretion target [Corynebacterium cystitidis]WJY81590.1 6 kDa early secretory antigenic target [Corynebacterium cystitidis DSM 20524]SER66271.1 WXG100 family type VII secretion target [Corynebacterium cystitidis DSM 20524]SNV85834.1 ESAT-6-like protein [Corynebacterium cystitidis]